MTSPALAEQLIVDKNLDIKQNASRVHGVEGQDDLEVIYRGSPEIYGSLTVHGTFSWTGYLDVGAARSDDVAGSAYVTAKSSKQRVTLSYGFTTNQKIGAKLRCLLTK